MAADDDRQVGVERLLFLRSLPMSRPNGPEAVQIAAAMRDVHFRRGQQLFAIGEASGDVFFLVKGSVRMSAPDKAPWDFEAPAVVGALDSFAGRARTRNAVATSDTHALALRHVDWLAVLEEHFDFARESMLRLSAGLGGLRAGAPNAAFPEMAADLPPSSRRLEKLDLLARTLALRAQPAFRAAGVQATLRLVELATELDLVAGQVLLREGEAGDAIYAVVSGAVVIERAAPPLRAVFTSGSLVGGVATLGASRHGFSASAAASGAVVLALRKDDVFDVMEDHFELTRSLLGGINDEREEIMSRHGAGEDRALGGDTRAAARSAEPPRKQP